ncbi:MULTISPECIES: protein adenylyltransferase SelO [Shewanella]|uniref:Protein nucleotidyltransferase YdiU n=1 Tax=Shewanella marisflavi TaxID=260364 RepID=A0ABX5WJX3_9GAMM|nr:MULTISPECIES: YdiU family protein [Shewanella]QDF73900.1 YdiU family protein [Shewanella marisflavi]
MKFKQDYVDQLSGFYSRVTPQGLPRPQWLAWSQDAAKLIGLEQPDEQLLQGLAGNQAIDGASYYAQVYSGHQFGGYSPQLGDGRSIILGEAEGPQGYWDVALKGAGMTPYSRHGDGRAVMRSAVREFLVSEALHHLNIPTTRALAVIGSDLPVWRETQESAAITVRLAKSHIRFGHFEYFCHSEQGSKEKLKQLLDFTLTQHYPDLSCDQAGYIAWFNRVVADTAKLIAHWQAIGFAHGVMNTDNMSILGDSFDFGPFAFLDTFEEDFICNHSDPDGRYAFGQQPGIGLWNLQRLAQAVVPLIASDDLIAALNTYQHHLVQAYLVLMRGKLGIGSAEAASSEQDEADLKLIGAFTQLMEANRLDHTNTWRRFAQLDPSSQFSSLRDDFVDLAGFDAWYRNYQDRLGKVSDVANWQAARAQVNPKYVLRNYLAQEAIIACEEGNTQPLTELHQILTRPFDEQPDKEDFAKRPPEWGQGLIMSCSS